jgi:hypothetical protein
MEGQSLLVPFYWAGIPAFEKGTRCKSETISSCYRSNGYVLSQKKTGRLSGRHRRQASSHNLIVYTCKIYDSYQAAFAGKPSSYRVRVNPAEAKQNQARLLLTTSNTSLDS